MRPRNRQIAICPSNLSSQGTGYRLRLPNWIGTWRYPEKGEFQLNRPIGGFVSKVRHDGAERRVYGHLMLCSAAQETRVYSPRSQLAEQASNHLKLLRSRATVVSVKEKSRHRIVAGMGQGAERKQTTKEVLKRNGWHQNWGPFDAQDKSN